MLRLVLAVVFFASAGATIVRKPNIVPARPTEPLAVEVEKVLSLRGGESTVPLACKIYSCMPVFIGMSSGLCGFFCNFVPDFMPIDQGTMVNQHGATIKNPNVRTWGIRNSLPAAIALWALFVNTNTAYQASFLGATWREVGDCILKFFYEKEYKLGASFLPFLFFDIAGLYYSLK